MSYQEATVAIGPSHFGIGPTRSWLTHRRTDRTDGPDRRLWHNNMEFFQQITNQNNENEESIKM